MKKYKLIKEYPASHKLGHIITLSPIDLELKEVQKYPEFWELVVEKDYQILSLARFCTIKPIITDVSDYGYGFIEAMLKCDQARIHSVKRLSDGEIFTIGDKYNDGDLKNETIIEFNISSENGLLVNSNMLKNIYKAKQPLFKTEDGVDVFEGDNYYYVNTKYFNQRPPYSICPALLANISHIEQDKIYGLINFSTKKAAENWIKCNKPCLNLNEVLEIISNEQVLPKNYDNYDQMKLKLTKLVKEKLHKS